MYDDVSTIFDKNQGNFLQNISMENSFFSDFLCPPACDSQNESLYNVDKNLNGTFELHCILKFEKKCNFGRFGHIWCTKSKINVSKISFLM